MNGSRVLSVMRRLIIGVATGSLFGTGFRFVLKEGLTRFTDQEFTADMTSPAMKRIDAVTSIRTVQFPEDASAMAHPIRPASVGSIENFYTPTVYEKGAEVIRIVEDSGWQRQLPVKVWIATLNSLTVRR